MKIKSLRSKLAISSSLVLVAGLVATGLPRVGTRSDAPAALAQTQKEGGIQARNRAQKYN